MEILLFSNRNIHLNTNVGFSIAMLDYRRVRYVTWKDNLRSYCCLSMGTGAEVEEPVVGFTSRLRHQIVQWG